MVVDILVVFNLLLGLPWVHTVGAIPSSLYQKVKFISVSKLIIIIVMEDIHMPASIMVSFIDRQQVDSTSKCHSFEFMTVNCILEGVIFPEPKLSRKELMIGHYFMKKQYEPKIGLGKFRDEILKPI